MKHTFHVTVELEMDSSWDSRPKQIHSMLARTIKEILSEPISVLPCVIRKSSRGPAEYVEAVSTDPTVTIR